MPNVSLMPDSSEIIHYDNPQICLFAHRLHLTFFDNMQVLCHWHEEMEFIHVLDGRLMYYAAGDRIALSQGDSLLINSRRMHYDYSVNGEDCYYICILFSPDLLAGDRYLKKTYVQPVVASSFHYFVYTKDHPQKARVGQIAVSIDELARGGAAGFELRIMSLLFELLDIVYHEILQRPDGSKQVVMSPDEENLRRMIGFIHHSYGKQITLEQISGEGRVSRTKCCQLFKKNMNLSPIQFLNLYRLERSKSLLMRSKDTISKICDTCGFNHLSYYTKMFRRQYGMTPSEYRQELTEETERHKEKQQNSVHDHTM